ncbi:hypothetical protein ACHWQZ_G018590 [Mnemiopsis leidyi]
MKFFVLLLVTIVAASSLELEERFLEELHIDDTFIDLLMDAVKSIDFKELAGEVIKAAKLLVCGEENKAEAGGLQFSFETSKHVIRIMRRVLCGSQ